jgi:hypothetical protein
MLIDVGKDFNHRLANRNKSQGDGKYNAEDFRVKYLNEFDNEKVWKDGKKSITFDFSNVKKIGPSFANEAFAHFVRYTKPEQILKQIIFINISRVQLLIIKEELESASKVHWGL